MHEPNLPLTVTRRLWDAVADAVRPTLADSYLSGAVETPTALTTHTTIAHERIKREPAAMRVLSNLGLKLICPLPFGHPDRPDTVSALGKAA